MDKVIEIEEVVNAMKRIVGQASMGNVDYKAKFYYDLLVELDRQDLADDLYKYYQEQF